ncbi:MAG: cytochrome c biogenesis protein CcdA [Actinomycetota bacterium]|nr:cytochrome c biogenesis protein CcdA [Actinomycetota bacterium]
MIDAPLALSFAAGLVSTVNPCGFAMLPAYLSYFLGLDQPDEPRGRTTVGRALVIGSVVSAGFLAVFGVVGILVTLGLGRVITLVPWAALLIGAGLVLLGLAMLAGYQPVARLPKLGGGARSGVFVFGVAYAVASLSCTLPVFLTVVAGTITRLDFLSGLATFLVYGLGMSLVLMSVTLALALGKRSLVGWLRRSAPYVNRLAGIILVVAGAYIVFFWATNLSRGPTSLSDPVVFVDRISSFLTELMGGSPLLWGVLLGALVVVAVVYSVLSGREARVAGEKTGTE